MLKNNFFNVMALVLVCQTVIAQTVKITGHVESNIGVENIHVINKTNPDYAVTNQLGKFSIEVQLNDSLVFSSIQHTPKAVVIDNTILLAKSIKVKLNEFVNQLDEVTIGKVLTGNLISDITNIEGKAPINFFDLGIPGYTGKPSTQSERRLSEASNMTAITGGGVGGGGVGLSLNSLINAVSGRTKMLKKRVKLERKETLMRSIKSRLGNDFFASNPLKEDKKMDFFYFCADDPNFLKHCKDQTDFKIHIFLKMKYKQYLENLKE
ncbi:MAG: hypothetical protein ACK5MZ_06885 [Aestuariibaculum sp.]